MNSLEHRTDLFGAFYPKSFFDILLKEKKGKRMHHHFVFGGNDFETLIFNSERFCCSAGEEIVNFFLTIESDTYSVPKRNPVSHY